MVVDCVHEYCEDEVGNAPKLRQVGRLPREQMWTNCDAFVVEVKIGEGGAQVGDEGFQLFPPGRFPWDEDVVYASLADNLAGDSHVSLGEDFLKETTYDHLVCG